MKKLLYLYIFPLLFMALFTPIIAHADPAPAQRSNTYWLQSNGTIVGRAILFKDVNGEKTFETTDIVFTKYSQDSTVAYYKADSIIGAASHSANLHGGLPGDGHIAGDAFNYVLRTGVSRVTGTATRYLYLQPPSGNRIYMNHYDVTIQAGDVTVGDPSKDGGSKDNSGSANTTSGTTTATGSTIASTPTGPVELFFAFDTMFGGTCDTYQCWITKVWAWATAIMLPLSIIMLIGAGALYATSSGNPDKIKLAKQIMIGVISGLVLIVLARVLLINFVGLESTQWNV